MCIKASFFTSIWGIIGEILPISYQVYILQKPYHYIIQRVYAILVVKIHIVKIRIIKKKKVTLKHFFKCKIILFLYFAKVLKLLHTTAQAQYLTKIQISNNFSQTQLTPQHKARLFSLQLLTYCSTIGASFSHIFSW